MACFSFDAEGRILDWNPACELLFGLASDQAIEKRLGRLLAPSGQNKISIARFIKRALAGEISADTTWDARRADGRTAPVTCYSIPIRSGERSVDEAVCVCIDLTEQHQARERLQQMQDHLDHRVRKRTSSLARMNLILQEEVRERKRAEEIYRSICKAARCLLFYAIVEERPNRTTAWALTIPDEDAAQRFLPLAIGPGQSYSDAWYDSRLEEDRHRCDRYGESHILQGLNYSQEFRCRRSDGEIRWLAEEVTVETLEPGRWRATGVCMDITERKSLETQLSHSQKLESIGQLAAGIAHEINTPIQYVGDNIRFLKDALADLQKLLDTYKELLSGADSSTLCEQAHKAAQDLDLDYLMEEIPRSIDQSLDGVQRVAGIVKAMKEFSHPGTGEKIPVDLNHALESTITVARNEWKYVAEVAVDFDPDLPYVSCLPGELNQVFLNLIINAAHAIEERVGRDSATKGTITIRSRRDGDWVEIWVSDTGAGIPDDIKDKVFDPFFTTKEVGRGTGQGLSVSRMVVVDKHQGKISFESRKNVGTTFIIRLPIGVETSESRKAA